MISTRVIAEFENSYRLYSSPGSERKAGGRDALIRMMLATSIMFRSLIRLEAPSRAASGTRQIQDNHMITTRRQTYALRSHPIFMCGLGILSAQALNLAQTVRRHCPRRHHKLPRNVLRQSAKMVSSLVIFRSLHDPKQTGGNWEAASVDERCKRWNIAVGTSQRERAHGHGSPRGLLS